jgi:DNA-binding CsgD family transcriptional regulator
MIRGEIDIRMSDQGLGAVLAASDWQQLRERVLGLLAGTGIGDFLIRIDVDSANGSSCAHQFGSLPAALMQWFSAHHKGADDPVSRQLARSGLPVVWEVGSACNLDEAGSAQPTAALRLRGICQVVSVTARDALAVSRVDFYRHATHGHGLPLPLSLTADLMLLASYLHEAVRTLWNAQNAQQAPSLTEREHACLYWSAIGKTSKETALILCISRHTVYFHLKNAARKFDVYSTRHAINRATRLGLIKAQPAYC